MRSYHKYYDTLKLLQCDLLSYYINIYVTDFHRQSDVESVYNVVRYRVIGNDKMGNRQCKDSEKRGNSIMKLTTTSYVEVFLV